MTAALVGTDMEPDGWPLLGLGMVCLLLLAVGVGVYAGVSWQKSRHREDVAGAVAYEQAIAEVAHASAVTHEQAIAEVAQTRADHNEALAIQQEYTIEKLELDKRHLEVAVGAARADVRELRKTNAALQTELAKAQLGEVGQLLARLAAKDRQLAVQENLIARIEGRSQHQVQP